MDEDLKTYLDARFAEAQTETRAIEDRLMERMAGRLDAVESRLRDFITEADLDLETRIVGEFWKWGRTSDIRTRQALTESSLLNERVLSVEDRISALERHKAS